MPVLELIPLILFFHLDRKISSNFEDSVQLLRRSNGRIYSSEQLDG